MFGYVKWITEDMTMLIKTYVKLEQTQARS